MPERPRSLYRTLQRVPNTSFDEHFDHHWTIGRINQTNPARSASLHCPSGREYGFNVFKNRSDQTVVGGGMESRVFHFYSPTKLLCWLVAVVFFSSLHVSSQSFLAKRTSGNIPRLNRVVGHVARWISCYHDMNQDTSYAGSFGKLFRL